MKTSTDLSTKKLLAGAALLASSAALSGCINFSTGFDGEPLAELDQGGDAPTEIALAGPDDIVLSVGDNLAIEVEGDKDILETLRFKRSGDSLGVGRDEEGNDLDGKAIIRITMPAPTAVSLAGSGDITSATLATSADISIAGSGKVDVGELDTDDLEINVAGSGSLTGSGEVTSLDVTIAGSGSINFTRVKADDVEISIAGSGDVDLASDGKVESSIMGSGSVTVTGNATCATSAMGSGTVTCKPAPQAAIADESATEDEAD